MANTQATGRIGDLGLNNKVVLADQQDLTPAEKSQVLNNILTQDQKNVLNGGGSSSSLTPDQVAAINSISAKADEFTEWTISANYLEIEYATNGVWQAKVDDSGEVYWVALFDSPESEDPNALELKSDGVVVATRKRVLRTGDADKVTDAQKAVLDALVEGEIIVDYLKGGLTINSESNGDMENPLLNIGQIDGTETYSGILRVNGARAFSPDRDVRSVVITGATSGDAGDFDPPSIKIGGKEVATVDQLREKVDELSAWMVTGSEYEDANVSWNDESGTWELSEDSVPTNFADVGKDALVINPSDWQIPSDITATRNRILRQGDASFALIPSATSTSDVVSCFNQLLAALKGTSPST